MLTLTEKELSLIRCIEAGAPARLNQDEIRAEVLASIVRGIRVQISQQESRTVQVGSAGIWLSGAKITGELHLEDASGSGGSAFPRISMEDCWFENQICLERSHLQSLSVRRSRFTWLNASDARIEGPVNLNGVKGIEDIKDAEEAQKHGQCWVVLASAKVMGRVSAAHARFVAPAERPNFVPMRQYARYALDLRATEVKSTVTLRPDCSAVGGICLSLASIDGSVWANGARVWRGEEFAFAANYAMIRGSLYLRPYDLTSPKEAPSGTKTTEMGSQNNDCQTTADSSANLSVFPVEKSSRFFAKGGVSLFACKLGGSLFLEGARIDRAEKRIGRDSGQDSVTLDVRSAEIGGTCNLGCWKSGGFPAEVNQFVTNGEIWLGSARIRNKLWLAGAYVGAIYASSIDIGGDCIFSADAYETQKRRFRFTSEGDVHITGASIKGDLDLSGACIGVVAKEKRKWKAAASADKSKEKPERTSLMLTGSSIGGNCYLSTFPRPNTAEEWGPKAGLPFRCKGNIRFTESRITNSFYMDGAQIVAPPEDEEPALDLSGTVIGGKAVFQTWHIPGALTSIPFTATGGRTVLKFAGTRIAQEFRLNGARLTASPIRTEAQGGSGKSIFALDAVNAIVGGRASLSTFLGECRGVGKSFHFATQGRVSFAGAAISQGLNLKGSTLDAISAHWRDFSSGLPCQPQPADDERKVLALDLHRSHVKFVRCEKDSCGHPFEAHGRIRLRRCTVDAELDLEGAALYGALEANGVRVGASVNLKNITISPQWFGDAFYEARLCQSSEEQIRQMRKNHAERALVPDVSFEDGEIGDKLIVHGLSITPAGQTYPAPIQALRHATVDLRGLHVGELADEGGLGWGEKEEVRLWLDGFRCARFPEVTFSRRPEESALFLKVTWLRLWDPSALPAKRLDKTAPEISARLSQISEKPRPAFVRWLFRMFLYRGVWERRLRWLALQYFIPGIPIQREFSPDAYQHLSNSLNATGSFADARRITSARLSLEARWKLLGRYIIWAPFRALFDYGLSVRRAVFTFLFCIALGTCATSVISDSGYGWLPHFASFLMLNTAPPETRFFKLGSDDIKPFPIKAESINEIYDKPVPCGDRIDPFLYALDVFVPVLNLHQQETCSIRPPKHWRSWERLKALYAVLGWILTPLTILTLTGILRRHIEK